MGAGDAYQKAAVDLLGDFCVDAEMMLQKMFSSDARRATRGIAVV